MPDKEDIAICPCCQQQRPYPTHPGRWKYRQQGFKHWEEVIVKDDDPEGLTMTHIDEDEPSWWPSMAEWVKLDQPDAARASIPWGEWDLETGMWKPNPLLMMSEESQHECNVRNGYSCECGLMITKCKGCSDEKK